ncbi:hypothetical protein NDU88_000719 [Pleurodeles waltl]|uniref:Uncharacterized protein n=1 Tax=Pleurodeles waltl TaxID=8319 RepID=A0AAV7TGL0_PLEWA|nr:hypothetical protein NDU88_000719 [Pleurodeles waltl]
MRSCLPTPPELQGSACPTGGCRRGVAINLRGAEAPTHQPAGIWITKYECSQMGAAKVYNDCELEAAMSG